ncbi:MAG: UDP-N-acetylmuramoyl-L-alanine--D-glutamate ligase [Acidobacteria bacterium]|nr:UDP-N-acetylmuramoyl-L-alanine--D-glutamate ligase [Acidobacteriota bacterium]
MDLTGRRILVVGLARTGTAVARFLLKRGSRLALFDDKTAAEMKEQVEQIRRAAGPDCPGVEFCLGGARPEPGGGFDLAILSPGVPLAHPLVQAVAGAGVPVISEIELACWFLKGHTVGITGSNGKTTCTALTGAILGRKYSKTFVSGNIGRPLVDQVEAEDEASWHCIELSSFQLETIDRFRPDVAVMLNLTPDHMDRYRSMEQYGAAKARIFQNQRPSDVAVLNADDPRVGAMAAEIRAEIVWFGRRQPVARGCMVRGERILLRMDAGEQELLPLREIPLRGNHNVENVLACAAAGAAAHVPPAQIAGAVRHFKGVEHRLEYVDTIGGVAFFNDSKATNMAAALKALEAFREPLVVIMGGRDKGADFTELREAVRSHVRRLVLIGEAAGRIEQAVAPHVDTLRAAGMEEAVCTAFSIAKAGDVVLLAPACASFDMFRDFEDRGQVFKAAVRNLSGRKNDG